MSGASVASVASTAAFAAPSIVPHPKSEPQSIVVIELLPPPRNSCHVWSGIARDGNSQRWMFGAKRDGEIAYFWREDLEARTSDQTLWTPLRVSDASKDLAHAVRRAVVAEANEITLAPASQAKRCDPIFEAIERHRDAFRDLLFRYSTQSRLERKIPADRRRGDMYEIVETDDPQWRDALSKCRAASEVSDAAAIALTDIRPTTHAGVMALLTYVEEFNAGGISLSNPSYRSEHEMWPGDHLGDDRLHDRATGEAVGMPWVYWVMRNVREALGDLLAAA